MIKRSNTPPPYPHDPNTSPGVGGYNWQPEQQRTDLGRMDNRKIKDDRPIDQETPTGGGKVNIDQKSEPVVCPFCGSSAYTFDKRKIQDVKCTDCGQWYRMLENKEMGEADKKFRTVANINIYQLWKVNNDCI